MIAGFAFAICETSSTPEDGRVGSLFASFALRDIMGKKRYERDKNVETR